MMAFPPSNPQTEINTPLIDVSKGFAATYISAHVEIYGSLYPAEAPISQLSMINEV